MKCLLASFLLFAALGFAQITKVPDAVAAPIPAQVQAQSLVPPALCPTFYALGGTFTPGESPAETGYAATSTLLPGITCNPAIAQPRIYSQYIVTPERVAGSWTLDYTTSSGVIFPLRSLGPVTIWALGNLGITQVGSTSSPKLGTAFGGLATIPLRKWGLLLTPGFEIVNGSKTAILGLTKSF